MTRSFTRALEHFIITDVGAFQSFPQRSSNRQQLEYCSSKDDSLIKQKFVVMVMDRILSATYMPNEIPLASIVLIRTTYRVQVAKQTILSNADISFTKREPPFPHLYPPAPYPGCPPGCAPTFCEPPYPYPSAKDVALPVGTPTYRPCCATPPPFTGE